MKSNMTIKASLTELKKNVKEIPEIRNCNSIKIGQVSRQGDVYIHRIKPCETKIESRKLVAGNSVGSNHVVSDNPNVKIFKSPHIEFKRCLPIQIGPVIEAKEAWTLTHPKHGWMSEFPEGFYQVTYQIDPITKERVLD